MKKSLILTLLLSLSGILGLMAQSDTLPYVDVNGERFYYYDIKKDESIYGIANRFGWDQGVIRQYNPAVAANPRSGQRIFYPDSRLTTVKQGTPVEVPEEFRFKLLTDVKVEQGNTLRDLARDNYTSVASIFSHNPGLAPHNLAPGQTLKINRGDIADKRTVKHSTVHNIASFVPYQVQKGDSWGSIAAMTPVDSLTLMKINLGQNELKRDRWVSLPSLGTYQIEQESIDWDSREESAAGINDIYAEVHPSRDDNEVSVLLLLSDPKGRKDLDYARGFLMAVDTLRNSSFKINLKVESLVRGLQNLNELADGTDLIITTCDKNFPYSLADYGTQEQTYVVNLFDNRTPLVENYPYMINLLEPSEWFNSASANWLAGNFGRRTMLMVNDNAQVGSEDQIAAQLLENPGFQALVLSPDEFAEYEFTEGVPYGIYASTNKKEDIENLLNKVTTYKSEHPMADIAVIGRPAWIVYANTLGDKFGEAEVYIPSRFYLDETQYGVENLKDKFRQEYKHDAQRTFPNFAACGYDNGIWFLTNLGRNGGDFNMPKVNVASLQNDLNLVRRNYQSGFENDYSYIVRFRPGGIVDKIGIRP